MLKTVLCDNTDELWRHKIITHLQNLKVFMTRKGEEHFVFSDDPSGWELVLKIQCKYHISGMKEKQFLVQHSE